MPPEAKPPRRAPDLPRRARRARTLGFADLLYDAPSRRQAPLDSHQAAHGTAPNDDLAGRKNLLNLSAVNFCLWAALPLYQLFL
jgi:hypothetical protein